MTAAEPRRPHDLLSSLTEIVASYVRQNTLPPGEVPEFIAAVHRALLQTQGAASQPAQQEPVLRPAVPIEQSVAPEYLVCLEDGVRASTLRRHLTTRHGMTAAEYRAKWGLPPDYPMVAPDYAARRSALAKAIGLGRRVTRASAVPTVESAAEPTPPRRGRGRPRKTSGDDDAPSAASAGARPRRGRAKSERRTRKE